MKITIENTTTFVTINGVETRLWAGTTAKGVRVQAYVVRLCSFADDDNAEFERELHETREPSMEVTFRNAVELRLARFQERIATPVMEREVLELDRLLKVMELREYVRREDERPELLAAMAQRMANERNLAYRERNTLACLLARCVLDRGGQAGTWHDAQGEPGFQTVVAFDLPEGQVSFHMDERDQQKPWATLPQYPADEGDAQWDGHTDALKWGRVLQFLHSAAL